MSKKMLRALNEVKVSKEEIWNLVGDSEEFHREHPEDADGFAGMALIARCVPKGDFRRAQAILMRMMALSRLLDEQDGAPGWTLPKSDDGGIPAQEAVFAAAAEHPLTEKDGDYCFDRESFLERVLALAEPQTSA